MMKHLLGILFFLFYSVSYSQELPPAGGGEFIIESTGPCITKEQYKTLDSIEHVNRIELIQKGLLNPNPDKNAIVSFDWPLKKAAGLTFNSYYGVTNFVDHDASGALEDYECGERTYDGHNGSDYATWPFPWYLYNNNYVEVIAGEAGTIILKQDGNADQNCSWGGQPSNTIYLEHADGSVSRYHHMKNNSLTSKTVGQSVSKGEYLGIVASSGVSTNAHLHFEVRDNTNAVIDPYTGTCNAITSWWASQQDYRVPTINAVLTHDDAPVHGCPSSNESPNFANTLELGKYYKYAIYFRDEIPGLSTTLSIIRPNGTTFTCLDP